MTEEIMTPSQVMEKYRSALAESTTIKRAESCLDRALQLLPYNAAEENLEVFKMFERRQAELRGLEAAADALGRTSLDTTRRYDHKPTSLLRGNQDAVNL